MRRKTIILGLLLLATCCNPCWAASGMVTLFCEGTNAPNAVVLSENEVATVKSYLDSTMDKVDGHDYQGAFVRVTRGTGGVLSVYAKSAFFYGPSGTGVDPIKDLTIAGPVKIEINPLGRPFEASWALLTLEIKPTPFAPDKATTIGPNAGSVSVMMEISTNLVDWGTAANGLVYTNSPAARFFRIRMEKTTNP